MTLWDTAVGGTLTTRRLSLLLCAAAIVACAGCAWVSLHDAALPQRPNVAGDSSAPIEPVSSTAASRPTSTAEPSTAASEAERPPRHDRSTWRPLQECIKVFGMPGDRSGLSIVPAEVSTALASPMSLMATAHIYEGMPCPQQSRDGCASTFDERRMSLAIETTAAFVGAVRNCKGTATGCPVFYVRTVALHDFVLRSLPALEAAVKQRNASQFGFVLVTGFADDGPRRWLDHWAADERVQRCCGEGCGQSLQGAKLLRKLLASSLLVHWFAQNVDVLDDDSSSVLPSIVTTLPIGLDFHSVSASNRWGAARASALEQEAALRSVRRLPFAQRTKKMLLCFSVHTEVDVEQLPPARRQRIIAEEEFKADHHVAVHVEVPIRRERLWELYGTHAFVASPAGHGFDCHRTWEALALGAVPIVSYNPNFGVLFSGLPVVMVPNFTRTTITAAALASWHADVSKGFAEGRYDLRKLQTSYWQRMFGERAGVGG